MNRPGVPLAEAAGKRNLHLPGRQRTVGENRRVVCQPVLPAGTAGAGYCRCDSGWKAARTIDDEGFIDRVPPGVGQAEKCHPSYGKHLRTSLVRPR